MQTDYNWQYRYIRTGDKNKFTCQTVNDERSYMQIKWTWAAQSHDLWSSAYC